MSTTILGIDPGSLKTGYALIEVDGRKIKYIQSGVLKFSEKEDFLDRLSQIFTDSEKLKDLNPTEVALESLIYVKSPTALIKLSHARAVVLSHFLKSHHGRIFEYSPNLIKSTTSGYGHADKESVQKTLTQYFGKIEFKTSDESDALAIALCHAIHRGSNTTVNAPIKKRASTSLAKSLAHRIGKDI